MNVDHRSQILVRLLPALLLVALALGGCDSGPRLRTLEARPVVIAGAEGSPDAVQYGIEVEILNPSDKDVPLERLDYTFTVKDVGVFEGRWAVFRTLPPGVPANVVIPASMVLSPEILEDIDLDRVFSWRIEGGLRYQSPGLLGQILFDAGIRRPTEDFTGSGTFRLDRSAPSEP